MGNLTDPFWETAKLNHRWNIAGLCALSLLLAGCIIPFPDLGDPPDTTVPDISGEWTFLNDTPGAQTICMTFEDQTLTFVSIFCDELDDLLEPIDATVTADGIEFTMQFVQALSGTRFIGEFVNDNEIRMTLESADPDIPGTSSGVMSRVQ